MKLKSLCVAIAVLFVFSGCKNEGKEEVLKKETAQGFEPNFTIKVEAKVSTKDDFAAYYTEDKSNNFDGSKAVWIGIDAGDNFQVVKLNLPQEIVPTNIRLDFGINKDQQNISIQKITMSYQGMSFEIKGDKFFEYFIDTKEFPAVVNPTKGSLEIKYEAGKFKTPYFYPNEKLLNEIQNICYPQ